MSLITLEFDQEMALPIDGAGFTITHDNGGTFAVSSVAHGVDDTVLEYTGTWAPSDPVEGDDIVTVLYSKIAGDLEGLDGLAIASFAVRIGYIDVQVYAAASAYMFSSFDKQQTLQLPASNVMAEFNNVRYRASVKTIV